MTLDVSVSIINFRTGQLTLGCVASVIADFDDINGHIVVVDNNSEDGSSAEIADWIEAHPEAPVELVQSPTNSGFSAGHNQGINARKAQYYLVLNSDAELRPGFLKTILAAAHAHPKAGLIAPRLEGEDGTPQVSLFRFHGPWGELVRSAATGPLTKLLKRFDVPLGLNPPADEIEWASFACILLRDDMVQAIGPMDEGYFLYFEDAEYCLRARKAGWSIVQEPKAVAAHFRGGSGPVKEREATRQRRPRYYYRSRTRFFYQAHGYLGLLGANVLWHLGRSIAQLRRVFGRAVPGSVAGEAQDIWINVRHPLKTRRAQED